MSRVGEGVGKVFLKAFDYPQRLMFTADGGDGQRPSPHKAA